MAVTHLHPAEASGPKGAALTRPLPSPFPGRWVAQGEGQGPDGTGVMLAGPTSLSPAPGARGTRGGGRAIRCWLYPDFAQRPSTTVLGSVPSLLPGPSCLLLPLPGPSPAPFHQALFRFFFFFFSGRSQNSCGFTNDTPCPLPSACPPARRAARALREPAGTGCFGQVPSSGPFLASPCLSFPILGSGGMALAPFSTHTECCLGQGFGSPEFTAAPCPRSRAWCVPQNSLQPAPNTYLIR